ncbi:hypothetical protein BaRGS_00009055 [Batillaria attramentaria]|uniref:Uncharacterized protein n=1 Tax=Batillaria attramentaria TaxID=370345 RepID=A0ABD0LJL8_9CAEN
MTADVYSQGLRSPSPSLRSSPYYLYQPTVGLVRLVEVFVMTLSQPQKVLDLGTGLDETWSNEKQSYTAVGK